MTCEMWFKGSCELRMYENFQVKREVQQTYYLFSESFLL